jgi:hypothetical protein
MAKAKWAIKFGKTNNFYRFMTGIGPAFGGTKKNAATFPRKLDAEAQINDFPVVASVMCQAVKIG